MDHLSWQHNFVMFYTEYVDKVEGYYRFILDLGRWAETTTSEPPPPGFIEDITQSQIEGMRSCTKKAQLEYLTCQAQVKERPQSELELFSRMTDKLVNLFNYMSRMHDAAVGFLTSIENNSSGVPNRSQHHSRQMIWKIALRYQHHLTKLTQKLPQGISTTQLR